MKLKVEYVPIGTVKEYENNAKLHPAEQIQQIKESIRQFGNCDPIGVWHDPEKGDVIVEGHGRLQALTEMGETEIPIIRLDHLTDEQRKAYALVHNKLTMNSDFDTDTLLSELDDILDIDMSDFGFDSEMLDEEQADISDDEYEEPDDLESRAQRGQVWVLGNHRVMCGDASSIEDAERLMGGVKARMVFTDPPYGVAIGDKNKMLNKIQKSGRVTENIQNDTLGTKELYDLLLKCFTNLREHCAEDCSYYVTSPQGGEIGLMMMMMMMRDAGLEVRHNLIWEKNSATFSMRRLDYDYQHEPIFYTWTKKHNYYGKGQYKTTVWKFDKPRKCDLHPTMKPIELIAEAMLNSSKEGDVVADFFGGSGSTLIAGEQLGRPCRLMEIDPHYVDVILDRWETLTGEKAVLAS